MSFPGDDYPERYSGDVSPGKAREILHDGSVHGHPLTDKQRRFFGAKSDYAAVQYVDSLGNPTHEDFHSALLNNPKERTHAHAYADWLEENGKPVLASFIRKVASRELSPGFLDATAIMKYPHRPLEDAPGPNSVYAYRGLGEFQPRVGRRKPTPTLRVSVNSPFSEEHGGFLSFSDDVPIPEGNEWIRRLLEEGHPVGNEGAGRRMPKPSTGEPTQASRYSATNYSDRDTISRLMQHIHRSQSAMGPDWMDENPHAALADALDDVEENPVSHLIRRQVGLGPLAGEAKPGIEPNNHLWVGPVQDVWGRADYPHLEDRLNQSVVLGEHGPFRVHLGHAGAFGNEQARNIGQRWLVHALSTDPTSEGLGYTFEIPHEEAHIIPQLFPAAAAHIHPKERKRVPAGDYLGDLLNMMDENQRTREARSFEERFLPTEPEGEAEEPENPFEFDHGDPGEQDYSQYSQFRIPTQYADQRTIRALLKQAQQDPDDINIRAVLADALEESDPNSPLPHFIRRQHGIGSFTEQGERQNNWWPFEDVRFSVVPGEDPDPGGSTVPIGNDSTHNYYLDHIGLGTRGRTWVVHGIPLRNHGHSRYVFEIPHEEAHTIPALFPKARGYIHPDPALSDEERQAEAEDFWGIGDQLSDAADRDYNQMRQPDYQG